MIVISCLLSRWVEASAVPDVKATTVARKVLSKIIYRHGCPRTILTDRGTSFRSELVSELCRLLNIEQRFTSSYHPQTDGMVERFNHTLKVMLSTYIDTEQKTWDENLKPCLLAFRTSIHSSTLQTPFFMIHGRNCRLPHHISILPPTEQSMSIQFHMEKILTNIEESRTKALEQIAKSQQKNKSDYDKNIRLIDYQVGSQVWLWNPAIKKGKSKKLSSLWHGPFTITKKVGPVNYQLSNGIKKLPSLIHHNRLKPFLSRKQIPSDTTIDTKMNTS